MAPALFLRVTVSLKPCDVVDFVAHLCLQGYVARVVDTYRDESLFVILFEMKSPLPLCFFTARGAVQAWV